jgi:hypothetical protein
MSYASAWFSAKRRSSACVRGLIRAGTALAYRAHAHKQPQELGHE